jgi:hypothetical protein
VITIQVALKKFLEKHYMGDIMEGQVERAKL